MAKKGIEINTVILRALYQAREMTQAAFAEAVGVSRQTVMSWMFYRHQPMEEHVLKMAEVLGVAPDVLLAKSTTFIEYGSTLRAVRFHVNELLGLNPPPTYREVRLIEEDFEKQATLDEADEGVYYGNPKYFENTVQHYADEEERRLRNAEYTAMMEAGKQRALEKLEGEIDEQVQAEVERALAVVTAQAEG